MAETGRMHHRWVGLLLSLLLPGAGIYLAGDKRAGLRWFVILTALWIASAGLSSQPIIPGVLVFFCLIFCGLVLECWMLVRSFRTVPSWGFRGWLVFLALATVVAVLELGVAHRFARPFRLPTGSMEPTLQRNDYFLVQTCAYWFSKPQRGDVVLIKTDSLVSPMVPKGQLFVKRIVALPGETVSIEAGRFIVNGRPLDDLPDFVGRGFTPSGIGLFSSQTDALTLTPDTCFVVGDNLTNSLDSRHFGGVPLSAIRGKATKIYWPPNRAGNIR